MPRGKAGETVGAKTGRPRGRPHSMEDAQRLDIYLSEAQKAALKALAERGGSMNMHVRRALETYVVQPPEYREVIEEAAKVGRVASIEGPLRVTVMVPRQLKEDLVGLGGRMAEHTRTAVDLYLDARG